MKPIDLRSDTVTRPSQGMLEAMMRSEVGDDVYGEDPTANMLQERMADLFGKEAGLFVPSGTMGNEIAIKVHTQPGDEVIVDHESHIFVYETAGPSVLSGVQLSPMSGTAGRFTVDQVRGAVRHTAYYMPRTALICFENTHGMSGGTVVPLEAIAAVGAYAKSAGISVHLDGARLWNASVATGITLREYAKAVDSVTVCFSKGLGAPVGSMLMGSRAFIEEARRFRKIWGGGMRQIGILAGAGLYALDHNVARLKEDHENAQFLASGLMEIRGLKLDLSSVQTNMVFIDISATGRTQGEALNLLSGQKVLLTPERSSMVRAVTHLDVSRTQVEQAVSVFKKVFG